MAQLFSVDGSGTYSSEFDGTKGSYSGGYIIVNSGAPDGIFLHKTSLGTSNWWARFQVVTIPDQQAGFAIGDGSGNGLLYILNADASNFNVSYESGYSAYTTWLSDSATGAGLHAFSAGQYIGYTVEHSTETVRVWFNVTAAEPDSVTSWDSSAADNTLSVRAWPNANMTRAGFGTWTDASGTTQFDNFTAGDFSAGGGSTDDPITYCYPVYEDA